MPCGLKWIALGVAIFGVAGSPASGQVVGRVVHVGFPTSYGDSVRTGGWAPVIVDLSLRGADHFNGYLRVAQRDKDGDLPYDQVKVLLQADSSPQRRYVLYCVVGPAADSGGLIRIEVLNEDGEAVRVASEGDPSLSDALMPAQMPERLQDDSRLILSLSNGAVGKIAFLEGEDQKDKFDGLIRVAHLRPEDLPDRWVGLDAVDGIVWDGATATDLTGNQIEALSTWVRHGGKLLIAAAKTTDTLMQEERLAALLPVKVTSVANQKTLTQLTAKLFNAGPGAFEGYKQPIPTALCEAKQGASVLVLEDDGDAVLAARHFFGRGVVTFVGAELSDLMQETGLSPIEFFKRTLQLRQLRSGVDTPPNVAPLFPYLEQTTGFRRSTGLYLLAALLFSIVYVGVSTFGSWAFLRSRSWTRHAWSAFAVVAGGAAVLSLVAVQAMRGVGQSLQQLTIVDAQVGQSEAMATAYFGLKTAIHSFPDVWMPADYTAEEKPGSSACCLKPLPSGNQSRSASDGYTDPSRYRMVPASAALESVPVRATLKQFEGRWFGQLRQTVDAKIIVEPNTDDSIQRSMMVIAEGSSVTNNLGVALRDCILVQPLQDPCQAGLVNIGPRSSKDAIVQVLIHPVGTIEAGETIDLAGRVWSSPSGLGRLSIEEMLDRRLGQNQVNWGKKFVTNNPFGGAGKEVADFNLADYQDALLMMTMLSELDPRNLPQSFSPGGCDISRRHCRQLDVSDMITKERFMLIGFADDQGPVTLCTRTGSAAYKPLLPDQPHTMYRFVIPVSGHGGADSEGQNRTTRARANKL